MNDSSVMSPFGPDGAVVPDVDAVVAAAAAAVAVVDPVACGDDVAEPAGDDAEDSGDEDATWASVATDVRGAWWSILAAAIAAVADAVAAASSVASFQFCGLVVVAF
jgi:hypothetical protein